MKLKKTLEIGLYDVRKGPDYILSDYFLFTVHIISTLT
jgi:hypothetical protein